ncbi:TPA: tyrosine-type recombinase/integrase [Escherichia fergusonii]|uniref:phage integrase n=1 Tax=Escherichia fergusonii TaxID=564 RepID=UPI0011CE3AC0|nr:tyrosine-type recombinase/integrase [Escherichia fergusonii]EEY5886618.1 site-specific integrase [Escherichia coli]QME88023.1 tyrosine-type recombinase/integrase [Escherichia fergusonii]QME97177.1 tyrosine-type recombinase/integrase [Escherichia fergusonii]QML71573.1 tyrosine-type recombinase/integrase [Escherichia fergusonii]HCO5208530.1 tyrosine-type recombinase/integrase [Escherichia fergusonii]
MSIKKLDDGRYEVDVRPQGADGKRIRRKFKTKGEAQAFERHVLVNYHNKEWLEKPADRRTLTELLGRWWIYHGKSHERGDIERGRLTTIIAKFAEMGVSRADQLTKKTITDYRVVMMNDGLKPASVNRHLAIMSGMFTKLIDAGEYHSHNPFREVKRLREAVTEMAFLSSEEITRLLSILDGDELNATLVCLSTGGRWSEVSNLKAEHIINQMVTFMKTKNGKRRTIPVSQDLIKRIKTKNSGRLFNASYYKVRNALREVKPDLPDGQAVHVLRHTFATHFIMNGGNIITLQRILGHSNIQQTMTYAHFAPDFLQDAVTLNPVSGMSIMRP